MYFPDDDDTIVGPSSFISEDTHLPPVGNTFWSTMRGIWAAIEIKLNDMNPFATDDNISDDNINDYYIINDADTDFVEIKAAFKIKVDTETVKYDDVSRLHADDVPEDADDVPEDADEDKVPEFVYATPGRTPRNNVDGSQSSQSSQYEPLTPWSQGASQVENKELFDVSAEKYEPPPTPSTSKSLMESTASSDSPPPSQYETTCDFAKSSAMQSICGTVATKNTVNSGVSRGSVKSKSVEQIIEEEESQANQPELQSVATTVLSGLVRAQKMNVGALLTEGGASKVYMAIANILYQQNVAIDVRDGASRGKSNEGQMREVWGSVITDYAKSEHAQCYLCGGQIVPCKRGISAGGAKQGGQPEMEHKLPCAVFYAKFAFIYSCFAAELVAWRTYVANLDDNSLLMQYYIDMNSNDVDFDNIVLNENYKSISTKFLGSLEKSTLDASNLELFVNFVLPAYLSEFAYSHHLCNQLKSNHDLSDTTKLQNYYEGLVAILNMSGTECIINAAYNDTVKLLKPACINRDICVGERAAIIAGLGLLNSKNSIDNRQQNVQKQNVYLQEFAEKYAKKSETTEKRMILHTIKETIKTMKVPILKDGKVTKKVARQMNAQARIIAQGLHPITNEVRYFLNSMETFDPTANPRLQQKANDKLRVQLDRTHQIFENAYSAINNITSQLKNAYVDPKIKTLIHQRATEYNNILSSILGRIERNIAILKFSLEEDDVQMISECKGVVGGLNDNLNRYAKKNPEVLTAAVGEAVPTEKAQAMEAQEAVGAALPMEEAQAMEAQEAIGVAVPMEAENAVVVEPAPLPKPPVSKNSTKRALASGTSTAVTTMNIKDVANARNEANAVQPSKRKKGGKKTRKVKKHHRKSIKKSRARKFTMKYKYISKKNTRRR